MVKRFSFKASIKYLKTWYKNQHLNGLRIKQERVFSMVITLYDYFRIVCLSNTLTQMYLPAVCTVIFFFVMYRNRCVCAEPEHADG